MNLQIFPHRVKLTAPFKPLKGHTTVFALFCVMGAGLFCASGCQMHEGSESQLKEDADSFATYYYNWHFEKAAKYCSSESEKWMRYAASNVHPADIDLLHNKPQDATIEIQEVSFGDDEVSAVVCLEVKDFYRTDTIGKEAHLVKQAAIQLPMTFHDGLWKVALKELP